MVCAKFAQTTKHGAIKGKKQIKDVDFYNLDIILAVGYRTKSSIAVAFRQWATKTLKQHITKDLLLIQKNRKKSSSFSESGGGCKVVGKNNDNIKTDDVLELIKSFSYTWFSLESYDKDKFPKKEQKINSDYWRRIANRFVKIKKELIRKKKPQRFLHKKDREEI